MTAVLPYPFNGRVTGAVKLARQVLPFDEQTPRSAAAESHLVDQLHLIGHDVHKFGQDADVIYPLMTEHGYAYFSSQPFPKRTYELMLGRMYLGQLDGIDVVDQDTKQWLRDPPLYWGGANRYQPDDIDTLLTDQQVQIARLFRSLDQATLAVSSGGTPAASEVVMQAAKVARAALLVNPAGLNGRVADRLLECGPSETTRLLAEVAVPGVLDGPAYGMFGGSKFGREQLRDAWKVVMDQAPLIEPDPSFDRFSRAAGPDF
jgi:hypothetical protein